MIVQGYVASMEFSRALYPGHLWMEASASTPSNKGLSGGGGDVA